MIELTTYKEFIDKFKVYPTKYKAQANGYEAHHIIPRAVQKRIAGRVYDDRCVRLTYFEHILAHYLYCKEHSEDIKELIALNFMLSLRAKELLADEKKFLDELPQMAEMREKKFISGESHPLHGRHMTEEVKRKHSEVMMGSKNPSFGRKQTEETISKRVKKLCKKVYQRDLEGNIIYVFNSVKEAIEALCLNSCTINKYLKGNTPTNLSYSLSYN